MQNLYQQTINKSCSFEGPSLHSGEYSTATLHPAPANTGIKFKRVDSKLPANQIIIDASFKNIKSSQLCTTIENDYGLSVSTIEHLMAALHACGIDNLLIDIDSSEMPILDGSAIEYTSIISKLGFKQLNSKKKYLKILKTIEVKRDDAYIKIHPSDDLSMDYTINYPNTIVGRQNISVDTINKNTFVNKLAECRTFTFETELEMLRSNGIIKGGSLSNAVVFGKDAALNQDGLRTINEPVKHKALDAIGDLFLAGNCVLGHIEAYCAGHSLMHEALNEIFSDQDNWEIITLSEHADFSPHQEQLSVGTANI
jgi:UDP-3-O-[3-hydroxymyristoyl] N-acetylglucosamine deacetylase